MLHADKFNNICRRKDIENLEIVQGAPIFSSYRTCHVSASCLMKYFNGKFTSGTFMVHNGLVL